MTIEVLAPASGATLAIMLEAEPAALALEGIPVPIGRAGREAAAEEAVIDAVPTGAVLMGAVPKLGKTVAATIETNEVKLAGIGKAGDENGDRDKVKGQTVV